MLVLSRKAQESITIGDNIVVRVMGISGRRVRLAIQAPDDVRIVRSEIAFEIPEAKSVAAPREQESAPIRRSPHFGNRSTKPNLVPAVEESWS